MFPIHDDTERLHGRPYLNYSLIAINAVVFIWEASATGLFSNPYATEILFRNYGAVPESVLNGNVASLVTSMFMHGSIAHIIGNMVFLFVFGDNLEDRFGRVKYLFMYIGWGMAAAILHSLYAVSVGSGEIPAVGASGAISGVLGAYLLMFPRAKVFTVIIAFFITTVRIPALAYIPFWFVLQVIFALIGEPGGVAYFAHIGGFIVGMGTGYGWKVLVGQGPLQLPNSERIQMVRRERPRVEEAAPPAAPEVIEGPDSYEIITEVRGVSDASEIHAIYESDSGSVRIIANGSRKYDIIARLPKGAINPTVQHIHYLNGIARVRLNK
ncbi:MAG: rhomboid family intramembrane serine protease [Thermoproteota archaeon]|jgi:membrane associated rhomboid family serine protease|nr:rhomboid family intramembrane serine protease [Thermoproteota archaeon]